MALTRRDFLATSSLAILAAACSDSTTPPPAGGTIDDVIAGRSQGLGFISVGTELLAGVRERLAFGLQGNDGLVPGATGRLWIARDRVEPALGPFEIAYHGDGLPEDRGFYETELTFPSSASGPAEPIPSRTTPAEPDAPALTQWLVLVEATADGETKLAAGNVQVGARNQMPKPGDDAPSVATPTTSSARGVDPICTASPPCGMHERSLDDALAAGDKTIVMIATPAFCTSRLCGPEVEILDDLRATAGEIAFVHIEVLANDEPETVRTFNPLAPAAAAWKLEEEPALYLIDGDGVIVERILGPADQTTFEQAIERLRQA